MLKATELRLLARKAKNVLQKIKPIRDKAVEYYEEILYYEDFLYYNPNLRAKYTKRIEKETKEYSKLCTKLLPLLDQLGAINKQRRILRTRQYVKQLKINFECV